VLTGATPSTGARWNGIANLSIEGVGRGAYLPASLFFARAAKDSVVNLYELFQLILWEICNGDLHVWRNALVIAHDDLW
jgi:hypothetical protein